VKVKRNTWHYWFYKLACGRWPPTRTNLCAYFWMTVLGLGMTTLAIAMGVTFLGLIGYAFYKFTAIAFTVLAGLGTGTGLFWLCVYGCEKYQDSEPGLVRLYVKAKKDKVCPLIEFEG